MGSCHKDTRIDFKGLLLVKFGTIWASHTIMMVMNYSTLILKKKIHEWFHSDSQKGKEEKILSPEEYQLINIAGIKESENHHYATNHVKTDSDKYHQWMLWKIVGGQDICTRLLTHFERKLSFTMQRSGDTTLTKWSNIPSQILGWSKIQYFWV